MSKIIKVKGWTSKEYYADCPYCGAVVHIEGETNCEINQEIKCDECYKPFIVSIIEDD